MVTCAILMILLTLVGAFVLTKIPYQEPDAGVQFLRTVFVFLLIVDLDNGDLEAWFFQNILVLEPMKVLYMVVFNYLYNIKCIDSFDIEMSLMRIINQIPELQRITEEPYFNDFTELYRMHSFEGDE